MSLWLEAVVIDAQDPDALGRWWAQALDWRVIDDRFGLELGPDASGRPRLVFVPAAEPKGHTKNRLHLDLHADDPSVEVDRLLRLGAARAEIGQGRVPWTVLCDPEGNEFCILENRPDS